MFWEWEDSRVRRECLEHENEREKNMLLVWDDGYTKEECSDQSIWYHRETKVCVVAQDFWRIWRECFLGTNVQLGVYYKRIWTDESEKGREIDTMYCQKYMANSVKLVSRVKTVIENNFDNFWTVKQNSLSIMV